MKTPFTSAAFVTFAFVLLSGNCHAQKKRPAPTEANVRYGKFDRNVLDFWQAPGSSAENPRPVLIFYHGGGWLAGDKSSLNPSAWLSMGISVVSVNYRFTKGHKDAAPYPAPMNDGARALQFVRSKAKKWHLQQDKVALSGSSAGAVISMWIAFRDDMKKPASDDPIQRISTRVTCVLPTNTPTTTNPQTILSRIGGSPKIHPAMLPLFDIQSIADLARPDKAAILNDSDPLTHLSAYDPPTYLVFNLQRTPTPLSADTSVNISIHHPEFGFLLKEKLDAIGVEAHVKCKGDRKEKGDVTRFLNRHLLKKQ